MTVKAHGRRLAAIWLMLVAASFISLSTSRSSAHGGLAPLAITLLIYVKSRLVLFEFMEVGKGAYQWRLFFELWLAAVVGEMLYFMGYFPI